MYSVAQARAPQEVEELRLRKFRRAAHAALLGIDRGEKAPREIAQRHVVELRARALGLRRLEPRGDGVGVVADLVGLLAINARHGIQYTDESGPSVAFLFGEVGAAPERLGVRREEHGERPAALLADLMQRVHVDRVHVRALLAVDLDVDEQVVHHRRGRLVLEALMRHDVAPMAGGVADREQDGLVRVLGLFQSRRPPGAPMDGVVLVLQEVGARLGPELVAWFVVHGPSDPARLAPRITEWSDKWLTS